MTPRRTPLSQLEQGIPFEQRHIGPDAGAQAKMLAQVGYGSSTSSPPPRCPT